MKPNQRRKPPLMAQKKELKSLMHFGILVALVFFLPIIFEKIYVAAPLDQERKWLEAFGRDSSEINFSTFNKDILPEVNPGSRPDSTLLIHENLSKILTKDNFQFNPNDLRSPYWGKLSIAPYKIKRILKYISKGGHFYSVPDIKKIYGLTEEDFLAIQDHISIPNLKTRDWRLKKSYSYSNFKSIPPYLDNVSGSLLKIPLNRAVFNDFRKITYLSSHDIWEILNFRQRNGPFSDIRELKNLKILDGQTYNKIQKYLTLQ